VRMVPTSWPLLILVFLLCMVALYGLGMMASSLFLMFGRDAWQISTLLQEPIYVFSGFFFPVRSLGFAIGTIASLIPLTLGIDAMRQLFFEAGRKAAFLPIGTEILILTVLSVVFLWLANLLLLKMENLGKKEGRLTLRWQ
jgi:ABC-2 type transport system permease protein